MATIPRQSDASARNTASLEAGVLLVILVMGFAVYLSALGGPMFRLDDGYIVLNNAQALFAPDRNFPDAPALYGSTSLLHTIAAALTGALVGPELGLMVLAWIAIGLFGLAILELARDAGLSMSVRFLATATAITTGDLVQVHLNGLETTLAVAVVAWLIVLHRRESAVLPFLAAAAPFVRPELFLLSVLLMADVVLKDRPKGGLAETSRSVMIFGGLVSILLILQVWTSGSLLPTTGSAKKYFFDTVPSDPLVSTGVGFLRARDFFADMLPQSLFVLALLNRRFLAYVLFVLAFLGYFLVFQPNIIQQNFFRYFYVLIPFFVLGGIVLASSERVVFRIIAISGFVLALAMNIQSAAEEVPQNIRTVQGKFQVLEATADWIEENLDPTEPALVHDVGYISFATEQLFFDLVGLKSPAAVELNKQYTYKRGIWGRGEAMAEMARMTGAEVLLVSTGFNKHNLMTAPLEELGWVLEPHPNGSPPGHSAFLLVPPS